MKKKVGMDARVQAFFESFSDKHRLEIIELLLEGEMNVSVICGHFQMHQSSVSHHLAILKKGRVLKSRRQGKEILYSVDRKQIQSVSTYYFARFGFMVRKLDGGGG